MTSDEYLVLRKKAFKLLSVTSKGMKRWASPIPDEQPYWTHPLHVYLDLVKVGVRHYPALLASILHDVAEDSPVTLKQIEQYFGSEVRDIVALVTRNREYVDSPELFYGKMHASEWAMYIKVFDRIDNLLTFVAFNRDAQLRNRYLEETEKYFIPMAKKIGHEEMLESAIEYTRRYHKY